MRGEAFTDGFSFTLTYNALENSTATHQHLQHTYPPAELSTCTSPPLRSTTKKHTRYKENIIHTPVEHPTPYIQVRRAGRFGSGTKIEPINRVKCALEDADSSLLLAHLPHPLFLIQLTTRSHISNPIKRVTREKPRIRGWKKVKNGSCKPNEGREDQSWQQRGEKKCYQTETIIIIAKKMLSNRKRAKRQRRKFENLSLFLLESRTCHEEFLSSL